MQHRDDKPAPAPGRPSLLSKEQQAEAARVSAQARQTTEAAEQAAVRAGQPKRRKAGWLAGSAAVAALCAGAGLWWAIDGGKPGSAEQHAGTPEAALHAGQAAEPIGQVGASRQPEPATSVAQATTPAEPDVPAAAILDQVHAAPAAPASKGPSLKEMLNKPSAPESAEEDLSKLLASAPADTSPAMPQARGAGAAAAAKPPKTGEKKPVLAVKPGAPKQLAKAEAKSDAKADDASLLAALVAHSKEREGKQGAAANASAPTSLKQCKQLNAAQAEQCRVRLCAGGARNEAECKARLPVKETD